MKDRTILIVLASLSLICWVLTFVLPEFPWLIALAVAPLFAIYKIHRKLDKPFIHFGLWIVSVLVLVFGILSVIKQPWATLPLSINFGIFLSFAFFAFWLTDTYARNRLGLFTVLLFYAGFEYISLLFVPEYAHMLLGASLGNYPDIQLWNPGTGLTGVSLWILATNIGLYYVFFHDNAIFRGIIRWRSLIAVLILTVVPAMISIWFYSDQIPLNAGQVQQQFTGVLISRNFADAGEIAGRTCAWISVFIILYALVKRKVGK